MFELDAQLDMKNDQLTYNADLFDCHSVQLFVSHYQQLLFSAVCSDGQKTPFGCLSIMGEEELLLVRETLPTGSGLSTVTGESVCSLFEASAVTGPNLPAVIAPIARDSASASGMRVAFLVHGSKGDFDPAMALAGALTQRGCSVAVFANAYELYGIHVPDGVEVTQGTAMPFNNCIV